VASRSWLTTLLYGVRSIFADGVLQPERNALDFVGATVSDDPTLKRTTIEFPASALLAAATKFATPNTLALRGASGEANFGGTCNFATIAASVAITAPAITSSSTCDADTFSATTSLTTPEIIGDATLLVHTPDTAVALASSAQLTARSGHSLGASGISGPAVFGSGNATQISGDVTIYSGDASTGATGSVNLAAGLSTSAAGGNVTLAGGAGATLYGSIGLGEGTPDFGGGGRVVWIAEASTTPSAAPANGGLLYIAASDGALHYFDRNGGDTILAPPSADILVSASASITLALGDRTVVATNANPTINLHAGTLGDEHHIKFKGSGQATITPNGAEKIFDSAQQATLVLSTGDAVYLVFDGTDWSVV
jgi:hypothetical protein